MSGQYLALYALALAGALGLAAPAWPQDVGAPCRLCDSSDATSEVKPATPVSLQVETSLDFDRLILVGGGEGTAELGPDGARSVAGSISAISSRAMVGEAVIHGEPNRLVRIDLPASVELVGIAGGSIRLESIRSDLPPMPQLDGNGRLSFRFGGVVKVTGDLDGDFRGDVTVEVQYL